MPTYEYLCDSCGHRFEKFQMMQDKPIRKCPKCGKLKANRLISPGAGILFKGSGFYQTDYRSADYKDAAKKETPPKEVPAKKETCDVKGCKMKKSCPASGN
ncbi:MAG: zinc ribbon domain-containing protein [Candidatus Omnitrophica bacterium]|nr:zinc ribbon domain-containing protein [Candidatus Omnitrophota bacterium]